MLTGGQTGTTLGARTTHAHANHARARKYLIKSGPKSKVGDRGRQIVDRVVKLGAKNEVGEGGGEGVHLPVKHGPKIEGGEGGWEAVHSLIKCYVNT